jgi:hypothetical protein
MLSPAILGINAVFIGRNGHFSVCTANKYHLAIVCDGQNPRRRVRGTMCAKATMKNAIGDSDNISIDEKSVGGAYGFTQFKVRRATVTGPIIMRLPQKVCIIIKFHAWTRTTTATGKEYQAKNQDDASDDNN